MRDIVGTDYCRIWTVATGKAQDPESVSMLELYSMPLFSRALQFAVFAVACFSCAQAFAFGVDVCDPAVKRCWDVGGRSSSAPAYPSTSSKISINPSAVPTDDGYGVGVLVYRGIWDLSLVKGTGRIGAGISSSNGEETFFGPPGFEVNSVYLTRKIDGGEYPSQKYALATGFLIYGNKKDGLERIQFNAGVAARYNKFTKNIWPGGGISGVLGPITFGYAMMSDETQVASGVSGFSPFNFRYATETTSIGIYLNSIALDYSKMRVYGDGLSTFDVSMYTASLMLKRVIFTASMRQETSGRPVYDPATRSLYTQTTKNEFFGGVQVPITKTVQIGSFYNYYLQHEISFGGTLFL